MSVIGTRQRSGSVYSAAGNTSRETGVRYTTDKGGFNEQGTDISFTSPATITGVGMPTFTAGSLIQVSGSPLNSREYQVVTSSATTITVLPQVIQTESAGALVDIRTV